MSGNSNDEDEEKILGFTRKDYESMAMSDLKVNFFFDIKVEELDNIREGGSVTLNCTQVLLSGKKKGRKGLASFQLPAETNCTIDEHVETRRVLGNEYLMSCHFKNDMYEVDGPAIASFNFENDPASLCVTVANPTGNKVLLDLVKQHKIEIR